MHAREHESPEMVWAWQLPTVSALDAVIAGWKHAFGLHDPTKEVYAPAVQVTFSTPPSESVYPFEQAKEHEVFPGWTVAHDPWFIPPEKDGSEQGLGMHDRVGSTTKEPSEQFTFVDPAPTPYPVAQDTAHEVSDGIRAGQSPVVTPVERGIALCKHGLGKHDPWMDEYTPAVQVIFSTPDCV